MGPDGAFPHVLKIGKLHSPSNLRMRARYFEEHYGDCIKVAEFPNWAEEDSAIKSSSYYQRHPQKGFKGFNFHKRFLRLFYMVQDMIAELEVDEELTSDDESLSDDEEELQPVSLPLYFDFERGLTFEGQTVEDMNEYGADDDSFSDEDDLISHRPVSRLSLEVDEKFDESGSDYDSDYFYCESEGEGDDNSKKVIYGPVAGIAVGAVWRTRRECSSSLVHVPCKSRIHAGVKAGCSLVLSSQEMVDDEGVLFTYKSKAKLDKSNSIMTNHLIGGNKALQNNFLKRVPIRVIRSYQLGNRFAPKKGYRYDGLYDVKAIIDGRIKNGNQYCEVNLVRCPNQAPPPWATNNAPAGDIPGHLLSTTEIDYNTGDEFESESDNRESPMPSLPAAEYLLDPKCRSSAIVLVKKLSTTEIEKATNVVSVPKEPIRKTPLRKKILNKKQNKNSAKGRKKPAESKQIVSGKRSGFTKTSTKAVQGSDTKSDSANNKNSNKFKKSISKNRDIQSKKSNKSANSSSLKQKIETSSSFSQKERLLDEKNVKRQAKKMAIKNVEGSAVKRKNRTENKQEEVVSNKKQKLAQTNRGTILRSSGKRKL